MSLNNSRGFPSIPFRFCIQWVRLSSPRMERKTEGALIFCRDQPKTRSSLSGFCTQDIREKIYAFERKNRLLRGNVPRFCIEPSTTSA